MKPSYYNRSTEAAFIEEVRQMRAAQLAYFAERIGSRLKVAKQWEAKIDKHTISTDGIATSFDRFRELVKDMRKAQCQYFAGRDNRILETAKDLERKVDSLLADYERQEQGYIQTELFYL